MGNITCSNLLSKSSQYSEEERTSFGSFMQLAK